MAKNFLNYGTAKGLGKTIDYTSIVNQRMQNEQLLNQSKVRAEKRAEYVANKMDPYSTEVGWITENLNKDYDVYRKEIKGFLKQNPNWQYTTEGQMKFNKLSSKFMDNKWVKMDQTTKKNYELLQQNMSSLTPKQIKREQEKYRQYIEGDQKEQGPYIFDASKPYSLSEIIAKGAENLKVDFSSADFMTTSGINPDKLSTAAFNIYEEHSDDLDDAWAGINNKRQYKNKMHWIRESLRATKQEGFERDYRAMTAYQREMNRKDENAPKNWYQEHIGDTRDKLSDGQKVDNAWLFTTRSNVMNPREGGDLNDAEEIYVLNKNGDFEIIGQGLGFDNVKITGAYQVKAVPSERISGKDDNQEYMQVRGIIDWTEDDITKIDKIIEYQEEGLLEIVPYEKGKMSDFEAIAAAGGIDYSGGEMVPLKRTEKDESGKEIDLPISSSDYYKSLRETKKYMAKFWVPIDRNSIVARDKYNKFFGGTNTAEEVSQSNANSGGYSINWDDGS